MIKVLRIGHATFETPDIAKAIEHFTQVIGLSLVGREDKRAFLASKIGQLAVELQQGPQARCAKLSFEVAANADFADLRRELQKDGVAAEERNDSVPGLPKVLSFQDPKGTRIELFREWSTIGNPSRWSGSARLSSATSPSSRRSRRRWRSSTAKYWVFVSPTGSATSSCSCAVMPTIMR